MMLFSTFCSDDVIEENDVIHARGAKSRGEGGENKKTNKRERWEREGKRERGRETSRGARENARNSEKSKKNNTKGRKKRQNKRFLLLWMTSKSSKNVVKKTTS